MSQEPEEPTPSLKALMQLLTISQRSWSPGPADARSHATFTMWASRGSRTWQVAWQWLRSHSFTPSWLPPRWRHPAVGYVFAGLLQVMAVLLTSALTAAFPRFAFPTAIVFLGVVFVALNWGAVAGLVAAVVGVALTDALIVTPAFGPPLNSIEDALALVFLVGLAVAISMLASSAERSKRRAMEERAVAHARELAARQVQAHMDEFLAIASHDLRSPLTAVSGYIGLATRSYTILVSSLLDTHPDLAAGIERVQNHLNQAEQASERLNRLVEVLFDTSRARAGHLDLTLAPCDLASLVREQVAALRVSAPHRTIELAEPDGGPVEVPAEVPADADRIGQVITNYLTNALKYSPASQPVRIWVGIANGRARVTVEDHGPGLPASEQERIWQQFYRAEGVQPQSAMGGSLGLGLYVCKRIIEGHGGAVGVRSEVGHGSSFWFELPLAQERARAVTLASLAAYDRRVDTPVHVTDAGKRGETDAVAR